MLPRRRNDLFSQRFVGRHAVLQIFDNFLLNTDRQNALYFTADGGIGKTWLLRKIREVYAHHDGQQIVDTIDFFDTRHQSILGLRNAILNGFKRLGYESEFATYENALQELEEARISTRGKLSEGIGAQSQPMLANLEGKANNVFIRCVQQLQHPKKIVFLFDTFERAYSRYVGQWLINDFLGKAKNPQIYAVIVGRPPAMKTPGNVMTVVLPGLQVEDMADYARQRGLEVPGNISEDDLKTIWKLADNIPLRIDLFFDHVYAEEIDLNAIDKNWLDLALESFAEFSNINRVLWAMACLRRRFTVPMLEHIVKSDQYIHLAPQEYQAILDMLTQRPYVKIYNAVEIDQQDSHLLHDEMQRLLYRIFSERVDHNGELRQILYDLVVDEFYSQEIAIADAKSQDAALLPEQRAAIERQAEQLRAEQFGYLLDRTLAKGDFDTGLKQYQAWRAEIERSFNYDFEDLLWGEIRDHLSWYNDQAYPIAADRGAWLVRRNLFSKANAHYNDLCSLFPDREVDIAHELGFVLLRRGRVLESVEILQQGLALAHAQGAPPNLIAQYENRLGMATRTAGRWDQTFAHYQSSFDLFSQLRDFAGMAGVCVNRAFLFGIQGRLTDALQECQFALNLLEQLPTQQMPRILMYAHLNMGAAYRHAERFTDAAKCYEKCRIIAEEKSDQELIAFVYQHIGINDCLHGSLLRRQNGDIVLATQLQLSAWKNLFKSLEIAREADFRSAIARGLNRMARVYRETELLMRWRSTQTQQLPQYDALLSELIEQGRNYEAPAEIDYHDQLLYKAEFSDLTWGEKAAYLYELSALVDEETHDYFGALDGWIECANLLVELDYYHLVPRILMRTRYIRASEYQAKLFQAIGEIIEGDLIFKQGELDEALRIYCRAFSLFAVQQGYPNYRLANRLQVLESRLFSLPPETRLEWCDALRQCWMEDSLLTVRPEMFRMLEIVRAKTLIPGLRSPSDD